SHHSPIHLVHLNTFPTRRSSDLTAEDLIVHEDPDGLAQLEYLLPLLHAHLQPQGWPDVLHPPQQLIRRLLKKLYDLLISPAIPRSEEHTSELQSRFDLVCRLLLE